MFSLSFTSFLFDVVYFPRLFVGRNIEADMVDRLGKMTGDFEVAFFFFFLLSSLFSERRIILSGARSLPGFPSINKFVSACYLVMSTQSDLSVRIKTGELASSWKSHNLKSY